MLLKYLKIIVLIITKVYFITSISFASIKIEFPFFGLKDRPYKISYLEVNREIYTESLPFNINDANPLFYDLFHNSHILYGHLLPSSFK